MKDAGIFLGREKNKGIFGGSEKRTKGFFGVCQKSSDFYWQTNSEVVISLDIKYKPLSDAPPPPPPLVVKICEWGLWELFLLVHRIAHKAIVTNKQYHSFTRFRK